MSTQSGTRKARSRRASRPAVISNKLCNWRQRRSSPNTPTKSYLPCGNSKSRTLTSFSALTINGGMFHLDVARVLGFQYRTDAERFLQQFRGRLAKFGLESHPDKTRQIEFGGSPLETGSSAERENQRPSRSWASPTSAGSARPLERSPAGGSQRRIEW